MTRPETEEELLARVRLMMKNRAAVPPEELLNYAGEWIAWSPDGTSIVAHSAESDEAVYEQLKASGYDASHCCLSYVPADGEVILGGASLIVQAQLPSENGLMSKQ